MQSQLIDCKVLQQVNYSRTEIYFLLLNQRSTLELRRIVESKVTLKNVILKEILVLE